MDSASLSFKKHRLDTKRIRQLFADPSCVEVSHFIRREIAERMHERLSMIHVMPKWILDAGCGEGRDLPLLKKQFPEAQVVGLDHAFPMLQAVAHKPAHGGQWLQWLVPKRSAPDRLCADMGRLPVMANTIDLLWSNLALHWYEDHAHLFEEWLRVMRSDGVLLFSCFGTDTLAEIRHAMQHATGRDAHVMPFPEMHALGDVLVNAGWSGAVLDREIITATYKTEKSLMADVRALGGNALIDRPRALMGKQAAQRFSEALASRKNAEGLYTLSFEIIYGHALRLAPPWQAKENMIPIKPV